MRARDRLLAAILVAASALAGGCAHVAPYERTKLADRSMTADLGTNAEAHVYAVQEGAAGGSHGGGGCGCN